MRAQARGVERGGPPRGRGCGLCGGASPGVVLDAILGGGGAHLRWRCSSSSPRCSPTSGWASYRALPTTPPASLSPSPHHLRRLHHTFDLARYLIWVDTFNLTSLVMLSIALVESILVHLLCRRNYMVTACTPMTSGRLKPTSTQTPREHLRTPTSP